MPMMVIAMMMAATHHPMAAHRPPNTIQSTLSSTAMSDIADARGYAGTVPGTHYIETDAQRQMAPDRATAPGSPRRSGAARIDLVRRGVVDWPSGSDLGFASAVPKSPANAVTTMRQEPRCARKVFTRPSCRDLHKQ